MKPLLKSLATSPVMAALLFVVGCVMISASGLDAQVYRWSQTAGSNATADPNINWAEGMSPSGVNDSARAMMAALAEARDDWSGANATGGTASAYTVSSNQGFDSLAHLNNQQICFTPNNTNAAGPTLAVDGLGAEPIDSSPNVPIGAGTLIQGTPYCVVYNNANLQFYLRQFIGNPYNVPLGGMMPYTGSSAPNSNFVLPYGQCISRTTYAAYFSLVSTTYGSCDGVTTFGVPDLRGRVIAGLDNMGGTSANLLSALCSSSTLGFVCGAQQQTITTNNIPALNNSGIGVSGSSSITLNYMNSGVAGGSLAFILGNTINANGTPANIAVSTSVSISSQGQANSGSPNTALPTIPPLFGLNYILRIF